MKTIRSLIAFCAFVALALCFGNGCTESPSITPKSPANSRHTYIIPITQDTFNAGHIHNMMLYYILTHYDTTKYAGHPGQLSVAGIDSLAHLFIEDSIQPSAGSFTSGEISVAEAAFDSTISACLTKLPTRNDLIASIDTAEAHGYLASDEANFIINADTAIRFCTWWSQLHDTINSLLSQYASVSWSTSGSQGFEAYEYLSIASHSVNFGGQPGDTIGVLVSNIDPVAVDADAWAKANAYAQSQVALGAWTPEQALSYDENQSVAASLIADAGNGGSGGGGGGGGGGAGGWILAGSILAVSLALIISIL